MRELGHTRPPDELRDTHYFGAKKPGRGEGYIYLHSDPRGFEVDYLPTAEGEDVLSRVQLKRGEGGRRWRLRRQRAQSGKGRLAEGRGHQPWQRRRHGSSGDLKDRAEGGEGTSPEELIAAAHASCILMALAGGLARAQTPPTRLESEAKTTFEQVGEGFAFTKIELKITGEVEGSTRTPFARLSRPPRRTARSQGR